MGSFTSLIGAVSAARRRSSRFPFHPACCRMAATSDFQRSSVKRVRSCSGFVSGGANRVAGWPRRTARCCCASTVDAAKRQAKRIQASRCSLLINQAFVFCGSDGGLASRKCEARRIQTPAWPVTEDSLTNSRRLYSLDLFSLKACRTQRTSRNSTSSWASDRCLRIATAPKRGRTAPKDNIPPAFCSVKLSTKPEKLGRANERDCYAQATNLD